LELWGRKEKLDITSSKKAWMWIFWPIFMLLFERSSSPCMRRRWSHCEFYFVIANGNMSRF
jgi:hypothetical protein